MRTETSTNINNAIKNERGDKKMNKKYNVFEKRSTELTNYEKTMKRYEILENEWKNDKEYEKAFLDFNVANAIAVLNKIEYVGTGIDKNNGETSGSDTGKIIRNLKYDIINGLENMSKIDNYNNNARELKYKKSGMIESKIIDSELNKSIVKTMSYVFGNGMDLVNESCLATLEEIRKQNERDGIDCYINLERPYTLKKLRDRVYIKDENKPEYVEVKTMPIVEIYKAIRRYIINERGLKIDPRNGYYYLEDYIRDDLGIDEIVYLRLGKFYDMENVSIDEYGNINDIIEKLELKPVQLEVLKYRLQGYGYKAIATKRGTSHNAVINTCKGIQKKAIDKGLPQLSDITKRYDYDRYEYLTDTVKDIDYFNMLHNAEKNRLDYERFRNGDKKLIVMPKYVKTKVLG